jgi:glucans biosynthesis protein
VRLRDFLIGVAAIVAVLIADALGEFHQANRGEPNPEAQTPTPAEAPEAAPVVAQQPAPQPPAPQPTPPVAAAPVPPAQSSAQPPPAQAPEGQPAPPGATPAPAVVPTGFAFENVADLARQRAAKAYQNRSHKLPKVLANLGYDDYREIRFRRNFALWRNQSLFEVQFFHRGFNFDRKVELSEVVDGTVHPIAYNPAWFDFGRLTRVATKLPRDLGFAGFRVHYPLQTPNYKDELIVFLGASYFRVLGRNQVYGLSARGLAINTGSTVGEEFPWFTDFWLVRPQPDQRELTIYALLDSESVTGAYRFQVRPGAVTQVEVTSELFPRRAIEKLGVAPLTSMFLYGEDPSGRHFDDYHPEVHDSDGLMAHTGSGEWLWRPLANPRDLRVNRFMDEHPHGFGLIQRDRDFAHYQDNEAKFERRPSYWIEPLGDWGKGGVELVEIPSDEQIHENIIAFWVPTAAVEAGKSVKFSYLLYSHSDSRTWPPGGKAIATRTGDAGLLGSKVRDDSRSVVIDYAGGDLDGLDRSQPLQANVTVNGGKVENVTVEKQESGVWRVTFRVVPAKARQPVDLHCYLTLYGEALTETWTYELT